LARANTDVNVYVYVGSRFQTSAYFSDYVPAVRSLRPFVDEFFEGLDSRIRYGRLEVNTLEDCLTLLFNSDHHFNAFGAWASYYDIITMMMEDTPEIGPPIPLGTKHRIEGAVFLGATARSAGYNRYTDTFFFYDYGLPRNRVIQTTQTYDGFETLRDRYLNGRFNNNRNHDHYVAFYPYVIQTHYPDNDTGRNLLFLGDSYSRGMAELLGANFDKTFVYDFRFIYRVGDYNRFIRENGITDVLIFQYSHRGVFNGQNDNTLNLVRTN
jgi:hypothetical protein